jgi:hypothetical protein
MKENTTKIILTNLKKTAGHPKVIEYVNKGESLTSFFYNRELVEAVELMMKLFGMDDTHRN